MLAKFAYLEKSIINSYNQFLLEWEKEFALGYESGDYSFLLNEIRNTPIDKVLGSKLKSSPLFTNIFLSIFSQKSPEIESIPLYYLIPNIVGGFLSMLCLGTSINSILNKNTKGFVGWLLGAISTLAIGLFISIKTNDFYNEESKRQFNHNTDCVLNSVDNISNNFSNFQAKLTNFKFLYIKQALELVELF
jgi:hypothetical protein